MRLIRRPDFAALAARLPDGAKIPQSANESSLQNGNILKIFRLNLRTYVTHQAEKIFQIKLGVNIKCRLSVSEPNPTEVI